MGKGTQILGVWLLRDEEYFTAWSLMNAVEFCDRVLVMDNRSRDRTREIVEAVAARYGHIEIRDVEDAYDTHKYLEAFAGTRTWVFGVDGDEVYDPAGLVRLRTRLLAGAFDAHWHVVGHTLHALGLRFDRARAFGHAQPATPGITKLYNFGAVESWRPGRHERLHGLRSVVFRPGYGRDSVLHTWRREHWDGADFRCLHLCFMPRSPLDEPTGGGDIEPTGRVNPAERMKARALLHRARRAVLRRLDPRRDAKRNYKNRQYARGPVATFDIAGFGTPGDFRDVDPGYAGALGALRKTTGRRESTRPVPAP